jgi:hypothetical protein
MLWQRAANFLCMRSSLLELVIVTELQAAETYSSLDLTKAKYSISRVPMVEKENVFIRINPSNFIACDKSDWGTVVPRINVENGIKLGFLLE